MISLDDKQINDMPYQSLASLRAAHADLVQERRQTDVSPAFVKKVADFIRFGKRTGALLDSHKDRQAAQSILDYWDHVIPRDDYETQDPTLLEFDLSLAPALEDDRCPYLGLFAFQEANKNMFYGRQRLINILISKLHDNRLLPVVGPSGSGKSSLVLAGLMPRLKSGAIEGSENWHYYPQMVPGSNPLINLAGVFRPADSNSEIWIQEQQQRFINDSTHLSTLINEQRKTASSEQQTAVLVVDQFEETFTLCLDQQIRQAFIENLFQLVQASGSSHIVIFTMRTDFESRLPQFHDFYPLFEQTLVRVTPLDAAELREAIEKPAESIGLKFEDGLVDRLLQDVLGEPAALPLLQFTLLKLWENRQRNRITLEAYRRLGGGRQALAKSADEFYESLIPEEQVTVRRIILNMVRPTEGLEVTSNRIRRAVLYGRGEARDRIDRVLEKLIEARLVRISTGIEGEDVQVEVAHEALVRNWPRLVGWLEDDRERIRRRLRLTAAAEQWQTLNFDPSAIWRGRLLHEALEYDDLNSLEIKFLEAGEAAELADRIAKEEADQAIITAQEREQQVHLERQRAMEQSRIANRLRFLTVGLIITLIAAIAAIFWAFQQQTNAIEGERNAQEQANIAKAAQATSDALREDALADSTEIARSAQQLQELNNSLQNLITNYENSLADAGLPTIPVPTPDNTPTPMSNEEPENSAGNQTPISSTVVPEDTPTPGQPSPSPVVEPEPTATPPVPTTTAPLGVGPETITIGTSVMGTPLEATRIGNGPYTLILVGGLHAGFAPGTVDLAQSLITRYSEMPDLIPPNITLYIIPVANPDSQGYQVASLGGLINENKVDLNRNWDCNHQSNTAFYDPLAAKGYQTQGDSNSLGAFSEPETRSLRDFIVAHNPVGVVFWVAPWPAGGLTKAGRCGNTSQVSGPLSLIYGTKAEYNVAEYVDSGDPGQPGQSVSWLDAQGIPAIFAFLPNYTVSPADITVNIRGVEGVMAACQTGVCIYSEN